MNNVNACRFYAAFIESKKLQNMNNTQSISEKQLHWDVYSFSLSKLGSIISTQGLINL